MIEKKFLLDDKEVVFRTSAAIPRLYRQLFGSDVFIDLNRAREVVKKNKKAELPADVMSTVENLAYCMAKHADSSIPDKIEDWLAEFSTTAVIRIAQDIMFMWNEEQKTTSVPKNQQSR